MAPHNVRLKSALTWGSAHELRHLQHALVRVELADGAVGIAEATPRPSIYGETQASVLHIIREHLAPLLQDKHVDDFASVAALAERLAHIKNNNTAKGALDMALHQALSFSCGQNLAEYLGITRERIRLSYIVSTGEREEVLTDVETAYQAGLRVFKVKIGRDINYEIATIERLINAFPAAQFYVDANETLESENAKMILGRLYEMGVIHCEEALPVHRLWERQQLRRDCEMPLIADDSAFTLEDLEREIAFDTFDILNIKTARTGFSQSWRMLQLCLAKNKAVMVGSQASSLLGCLHAVIFAGYEAVNRASECSFFLKTDEGISQAPTIADGYLELETAMPVLERIQSEIGNFV